jgi:hypothetical protein
MKNGKSPGEGNINSEFCRYAPEEFKLRFLQFFNNIYTENCIQMNGEIPFQTGDRRGLKNYSVISILNTCCKIYSKILNTKLQTC